MKELPAQPKPTHLFLSKPQKYSIYIDIDEQCLARWYNDNYESEMIQYIELYETRFAAYEVAMSEWTKLKQERDEYDAYMAAREKSKISIQVNSICIDVYPANNEMISNDQLAEYFVNLAEMLKARVISDPNLF